MIRLEAATVLLLTGCATPEQAWPAIPQCPLPFVQAWMTRKTDLVTVDGMIFDADSSVRQFMAGRVVYELDSIMSARTPGRWVLLVHSRPAIPADSRAAVCPGPVPPPA